MNPERVRRWSPPLPMLVALLAVLWIAPPEIHPHAAAAVFALLAGAGLAAVLTGWLRPVPSELRFMAALALPLALSWLPALDRGAAVDRLLLLAGALLIFGLARRLETAEGHRLLALMVAAGTVLSLYALWQYVAGFDRILAAPDLDPAVAVRLRSSRVFARFLLPSVFASFLLLALPVAAGLARAGRGAARAAALAAAGLMALAMVLTRSHGAFAALLLAAVGWTLLRSRRRLLWTGLALAAALAGFGTVAWARGGVFLEGAEGSGPAALRLRNARAALEMLAAEPVTGVGGGGYGSAYPAFRRPGDNETRFAHNSYLQVLAEHGLTMLLPLGLLAVAWSRALRQGAAHPGPAQAGAAFGLTAFALHAGADMGGLLPATLWTSVLVAGILAGPGAPARRRRAWLAAGPAMGAAMAAALIGIGWVGLISSLATGDLESARSLLQDGRPAEGLAAARAASRRAPWQAGAWLLQAEVLLRHSALASSPAGALPEALRAADTALLRAPAWPAAYAVRATAHAAAGDAGAAAADLERAAELYPMSPTYRAELKALTAGLPPAPAGAP